MSELAAVHEHVIDDVCKFMQNELVPDGLAESVIDELQTVCHFTGVAACARLIKYVCSDGV